MPRVLRATCTTSNSNGNNLSAHLVSQLEKVLFSLLGISTDMKVLLPEITLISTPFSNILKGLTAHTVANNCLSMNILLQNRLKI